MRSTTQNGEGNGIWCETTENRRPSAARWVVGLTLLISAGLLASEVLAAAPSHSRRKQPVRGASQTEYLLAKKVARAYAPFAHRHNAGPSPVVITAVAPVGWQQSTDRREEVLFREKREALAIPAIRVPD